MSVKMLTYVCTFSKLFSSRPMWTILCSVRRSMARSTALTMKALTVPQDANHVSVHGVSPQDVKTARKVLLAMIENLARDELVGSNPVKREMTKKSK